jgi:transcriptional regulator with XRE-family HTH domain
VFFLLSYSLNNKKKRNKKKISQKNLAISLNTSQQQVSIYETYDDIPSLTRLIEIAQVLDVTLDELVNYKKIHEEYSVEIKKINNKE